MLHRNMTASTVQLGLEDLLGDLQCARRTADLSRLALLAYCEARRWARTAGERELAAQSSKLMTHSPHATREQFLAEVDELIVALEQARSRVMDQGDGPGPQA